MDTEAVLDCLMDAGVSVWLDAAGTLRIDKHAPAELKELVRAHKQELIDVRKAQAIMKRPGSRIIRLPLGHLAVAYPLRANVEEIRWAMRVLRMDSMPLVINDEGLKWAPYDSTKATEMGPFSKTGHRGDWQLRGAYGAFRAQKSVRFSTHDNASSGE